MDARQKALKKRLVDWIKHINKPYSINMLRIENAITYRQVEDAKVVLDEAVQDGLLAQTLKSGHIFYEPLNYKEPDVNPPKNKSTDANKQNGFEINNISGKIAALQKCEQFLTPHLAMVLKEIRKDLQRVARHEAS